jgi:type IV pilus assembly protein PilC
MPKYRFTAVDVNNKKVSSVIDARDEDDLRRKLRAQQLFPKTYKEIEEQYSSYRLKANECSEFSRQLAGMLSSGITAIRAMEILKDREGMKPALLKVYSRLHKDVSHGATMSEAMRMQGRAFPELLINMYSSGEASGQLEQVASKMAVHYEKEHRLNGKVQTAMTYPMILLVVTFGVVLLIFTVVLPEFFKIFEGIELPAITRAMIAISEFLQDDWYYVIIATLCFVAFFRWTMTFDKAKTVVGRWSIRLWVVGRLLKIIYTARFSRTLASLYGSGVSMLRALEIGATITGNKYIEIQFVEVVKKVRNGDLLSESVGTVDGFDRKLATSILIGEESGRLDTMLESIADDFDYEAEMATGRLVQFVEPVMIVIMAVLICFVMLAVMLPIFTLYQNVGM